MQDGRHFGNRDQWSLRLRHLAYLIYNHQTTSSIIAVLQTATKIYLLRARILIKHSDYVIDSRKQTTVLNAPIHL